MRLLIWAHIVIVEGCDLEANSLTAGATYLGLAVLPFFLPLVLQPFSEMLLDRKI